MLGKQHHYCPNCGKPLYDDRLSMGHTLSLMCCDACRREWELKYARSILGKDADPKQPKSQKYASEDD